MKNRNYLIYQIDLGGGLLLINFTLFLFSTETPTSIIVSPQILLNQ